MKLLSDEQLDQIMDVSLKGTPIVGTAIHKLCTDLKMLRGLIVRLIEHKDDKEEIELIVNEAFENL